MRGIHDHDIIELPRVLVFLIANDSERKTVMVVEPIGHQQVPSHDIVHFPTSCDRYKAFSHRTLKKSYLRIKLLINDIEMFGLNLVLKPA